MQQSSVTDTGASLAAALGERDFDRLADVLSPDVRMRALIPPGPAEVAGRDAAAARFASWFGDREGLTLMASASEAVGDRVHVSYRLRLKDAQGHWKIVEQHLFCTVEGGRISALDLVCSGFRPEEAAA